MESYKAKIYVQLKASVLDPQGQAVLHALHTMDHKEVDQVRIGKYIEVHLKAASMDDARLKTDSYCNSLLVNSVVESFNYDIVLS